VQRQRFFFNLGAIVASVLMIVAAVAFAADAVKWIGLGIGIAGTLASMWFTAMTVHDRSLPGRLVVRLARHGMGLWTVLASAVLAIALWETVQSAVFPADPTRWLTLANGIAVAAIACAGLIAHELCTERIVHVLQVVDAPHDRA
jgi:hypothetical protein